jgi:NAD-dependent dihydropyrimidine dehydrogenase PreA subunit
MKLEYLKNVSSIKIEDPEKCTGCRMCVEVCPHAVFGVTDSKAFIKNRNACMECGACKINCPAGIIKVDSGVGCAAAIISGLLTNSEASCGCSGEKKSGSCCG